MRILNDSGFTVGWLIGRVPPYRLSATFMVKGTFDLKYGVPVMPSEDQLQFEGDLLEEADGDAIRYASDFVPQKPQTDVLLVGKAYSHEGKGTKALNLTFSVGTWSKTLLLLGDRFLKGKVLFSNVPTLDHFQSQQLSWKLSYGGAGYEKNPQGKGFTSLEVGDGKRTYSLPNIIRPQETSVNPFTRLEPAGFGPIAPAWPQRLDKARKANWGKKWLRESWPGFPLDFDWSYFNASPLDQQISGRLRGDERVCLENLHPTISVYETKLPAFRLRWFVNGETKDGMRFWEVPLNIDTLWVDTETQKVVLIWRGVGPILSKKMREIRHHYIFRENLNEPSYPLEHYRQRMEDRLKELDMAAVGQPFQIEEIPPIVIPKQEFDWNAWEKDLEDEVSRTKADLELEESKTGSDESESHVISSLKEAGIDPALLAIQPVTDPKLIAAQIGEQYADMLKSHPEGADLLGPAPSEDELSIDKKIKATEKEFENLENEFDRVNQKPVSGNEKDWAVPKIKVWTRESCLEHAAQNGDFSGGDLSGLDLHGEDFNGLLFRGAILKNTKLNGSNLANADFSRAVLVEADLTEADLSGANLTEADVMGAFLVGSNLCGAILTDSNFSKTDIKYGDLTDVIASRVLFAESDLTAAKLHGGDFTYADFTGAHLEGADLSKSCLNNASAYQIHGNGINMMGADLLQFRTGEEADFRNATFIGVNASDSVWDGSRLDGADFTRSILSRASFPECSLIGTKFVEANLSEVRMADVDLEQAILRSANLFRATMEDSRLTDTDFQYANLYEVEFLDTIRDGADFRHAVVKGSKLEA